MSRAEVYEDQSGEFRWRIRARNGRVIADSGESYRRREDAERGLQITLSTEYVDEDHTRADSGD